MYKMRLVINVLMVLRREIKEAHENSVLASFKQYLNDKGHSMTVKSRPDPPDAFIAINGADTWIEITDAFFSEEVAISITSYTADDVTHRPTQSGWAINPDEKANNKVEMVIDKKLNKSTMIDIANSNGKGVLLVGLFGPFFDLDKFANNLSATLKNKLANQNVFDSVYLYQTCNEDMCEHRYKRIL